jgi:hypothetical protein
MSDRYYNLYLPYNTEEEAMFTAIDKLIKLGFTHIALTFDSIDLLDSSRIEPIMKYCNNRKMGLSLRFHISKDIIDKKGDKKPRNTIMKLRRKISKKVCITSIDDALFQFLTPNDSYKFDIILLKNPSFKMLLKLIDKPILFELMVNKSLTRESWLRRRLFMIKILLEKNKIVVSQDVYSKVLYPPKQLVYFIYGLVGDQNISYNLVSTLPMELINKCR